jgi:DNA-binding transcriptional MerR regulator
MSNSKELLPPIPDKDYFSIGETSKLCNVKPHVLRYWEQEFPKLKPCTRTGGRRYYKQKDLLIIRKIKELLYSKGFTISGARKQLQPNNKTGVIDVISETKSSSSSIDTCVSNNNNVLVEKMIAELQRILDKIK